MPRTKKVDANAPTTTETKSTKSTTKSTNSAKKTTTKSTTSSKKPTASEMREFQKQEYRKELYAKAQQAINLLDLTKNQSRSYTIYNKENLRTYMKNPASNENRLRNLSRFLYRVSQPYRRLINYNAQQVDLTAMVLSPNINITEQNDTATVLKDYYDTCVVVDRMHLESEIYKMLVTAWIEDAAYGYIYEDDTGFFIYPLDGEFCKISSTNMDGTFNFAFNFSYFKSRQELLEYWDSEFKSKYDAYSKDSKLMWQELDPERTICIKIGADDPTLCIPPYLALFESIIDNVDLQSIVSVKDELSIYKLLVARLEHMSNSDDPNDFEIDIDTALEYYRKFEASLPDCVSSVISPMPIEPIEFKGTTTDDTDMIANSMSNLFKISGGSMVLNDQKQGASIFRAHIIADMMQALKPLLGQIQSWMNRHLSYLLSNPARVKYLETSPWMKNEKKKELIESAQYGVPVKMAVAALDGFSPLEVLRMQFLENDTLALHDAWIPLQSSFVQSGKDSGGQEKDITELTDEGDASREKEKSDI